MEDGWKEGKGGKEGAPVGGGGARPGGAGIGAGVGVVLGAVTRVGTGVVGNSEGKRVSHCCLRHCLAWSGGMADRWMEGRNLFCQCYVKDRLEQLDKNLWHGSSLESGVWREGGAHTFPQLGCLDVSRLVQGGGEKGPIAWF